MALAERERRDGYRVPSAGDRVPRVPWWRSFVLRFVGLYTILSIGLALLAINWFMAQYAEEITRTSGETLEAIAATASLSLPGDSVGRIRTNADAQSPQFEEIRDLLETIRRTNGLKEEQIYILRPHKSEADTFLFVAMLQEDTFVGDVYHPPPKVAPCYRAVMDTGTPQRTPLFTDKNGTFIGGLAPITDSRGEIVGILEVDHDINDYMEAMETAAGRLKMGLGVLVILLIVAGIWLYHHLQRSVVALLKGTQAIDREDYNHQIPILGRDELGMVAFALNRVTGKLKERFEMLKFLPRHTLKMISNASGKGAQVDLSVSKMAEVTILESDIRGFTRLSEHLPPAEVIALLNRYVRAQAELITEHGGSIDKYMGDAVLAIFEGPDRVARAVDCAAHIITALKALQAVDQLAEPVLVGIGLSDGDVVMGNMGSEHRMEHTVIGATVNLAARLCSAAKAEEVVFKAEMLPHLAVIPPGFEASELLVNAKGFSEDVPCIRLSLR